MLSCSCPDYGELSWYFYPPEDFVTFQMKRRRRCSSCNELINHGNLCLQFVRFRDPKSDIEERICGTEVPMSPLHMCEKCGDQFMNLDALGFCVNPEENMFDLLKEYRENYGSRSGSHAEH